MMYFLFAVISLIVFSVSGYIGSDKWSIISAVYLTWSLAMCKLQDIEDKIEEMKKNG